ncbi:TerD family protein [Sinomonas sp. ASV486]|uniref:TerD family protein n=1 Tax=Sinomonas sp. ASV486 TaxID=3051170 RepID=UPI0027DC1D9C|nr:TerD family protein [Sinomonas sp. ASV486]MDQ4489177.1 TerD family protein [Sinomonas sp. ASV486]
MGLSLQKGQGLSLTKKDGSSMAQVRLGLGWDAVEQPRKGFLGGLFGGGATEIDLDASAILYNAGGQALDTVFFNQLTSKDGSIRHTGDNLTGAGDGDDETIMVNLPSVNGAVQHIVFVITSYSQQTFNQIKNAFCRVIDDSAGGSPEVARYTLTDQGPYTAMIMAKLSREGAGWKFTAIGQPANGRTVGDLVAPATAVLAQ